MEIEKIRNLSDEELAAQQKQAAEQLFRLRFQISTGQPEGVKKLREIRKDIARMKTIARYRQLHGATPVTTSVKAEAAPAKKAVKKAAVKKSATKAAPAKKAATKKSAKGDK